MTEAEREKAWAEICRGHEDTWKARPGDLDAALRAYDADWSPSVSDEREGLGRRMVGEILRLRGLVKYAEWVDSEAGYVCCPWCENGTYYTNPRPAHLDSCPAFTEDGQVK